MERMSGLGLGLALALAPLPLAATAAAQQTAPPVVDRTLLPYASSRDSVRLPDGRTLHLVCMGKGRPVVILTAGAGDWGIAWSKVQPAVAETTRVCAWDRAGFGLSAISPKPQTVDAATTDLEAALKLGGLDGPYVVVGHSLGAFESLLLADRQPSKVVGMVLVDPSIPDQAARFDRVTPAIADWMRTHQSPLLGLFKTCAAALRAGTVRPGGPDPDGCLHPPPSPPTYPPELRTELDGRAGRASPETVAAAMDTLAFYSSPELLRQDSQIVVRPDRNYGRMPLVVLTAGDFEAPPDFPAAARAEIPLQRAEWARAHDAYAALSTRGVNRTVAGSSHYIQQQKPQAVIDAIDEVVAQARAAAPPKRPR